LGGQHYHCDGRKGEKRKDDEEEEEGGGWIEDEDKE